MYYTTVHSCSTTTTTTSTLLYNIIIIHTTHGYRRRVHDNIIDIIIYCVQKYRRTTACACIRSCFLCRCALLAYCVIVIGFSISQTSAPGGPREETKYDLQGGGSVGGGAANAVRQCCHVVAVAGTRRLPRPVSVHVAGVFCFFLFSHSQRRGAPDPDPTV